MPKGIEQRSEAIPANSTHLLSNTPVSLTCEAALWCFVSFINIRPIGSGNQLSSTNRIAQATARIPSRHPRSVKVEGPTVGENGCGGPRSYPECGLSQAQA